MTQVISDRVRTAIITVVTVVWATNFMAGLFVAHYHPSESINGIFMAIVGGLFALGARETVKGKDEKKKDEDEAEDG